jgi:hypothetical protein
VYLRLGAAIAAIGAAAAAIVIVVTLLQSVPGPTSTSSSAAPAAPAPTTTPAPPQGGMAHGTPAAKALRGGRIATPDDPAFPSPPPGAVVLAQEAGTRALAIAYKPGLMRVSVLDAAGDGESGLRVALQFGRGYLMTPSPCGPGCYQADVAGVPDSPVTVSIGGKSYRFELPRLPAADGTALVSKATDTWNALRTLVWRERLGSSPTNVLHTLYRAVAPHSLAYSIRGRSSSVIIDGERWDRATPTSPWLKSSQDPPLDQPQPFWDEATNAHVLGTAKIGSHRVTRVSFFDPTTPAWFEAAIDPQTGRTLQLDMTAASHFMHDVYGPFNAPFELQPPATT